MKSQKSKVNNNQPGSVRKVNKGVIADLKRDRVLYLLLLIPFTVLILFSYVPMYGVQIAFRDYNILNGIWESPWVGLKHFIRFFKSPVFWPIVRNTLVISFYSLATFPLPVILAILLNYLPSVRFRKTVQMLSYAPHFLSTVVMCGIILQFLDKRSGVINAFLGLFGVEPANYMASAAAFPHIYIWSGVWQGVGYSSIIYIAALEGISPELHEAAIIDGASIFQRIRNIDLPLIMPTVCIMLILACGSIMNVNFEKILLLQNNLNISTSEVIGTYVYKQGFASAFPQYSYSSAIGMFSSVVNMILLITVNEITRKLNDSGLW